jgi:hypothetical protein
MATAIVKGAVGPRMRLFTTSLSRTGDLAADVADGMAEPRAQQAQLPTVTSECSKVAVSANAVRRGRCRGRRWPRLKEAELSKALRAGKRLDESTPGFGFGLLITRELAKLYGGSLEFAQAPCGGLRIALHLPQIR